ncbi:MAG: glutamine amidotransferase [Alphaproteobacteria bacterium]|nr:glutamine amidotransferase [Alphaproteobacteria bacterium]
MPTAIAIRHVACEDLDAFGPALAARGYKASYREAPTDDLAAGELADCDLLVVLGGPIGAYEDDRYPFLKPELALIERRLKAGKPVLGICLGAQLMARSLGAKVYAAGFKEIGWAGISLSAGGRASPLAKLAAGTRVLHWHGDTFDLPSGAAHLASTLRTPNQAFAVGRYGLALQFHLEVSAPGLERWLVGHAVEINATPRVTVPRLRADAAKFAAELVPQGRAVLDAWLDGLKG